jgi:hypothetical protein
VRNTANKSITSCARAQVTHYYLDRSFGSDRPHVGTVMLTNLTLDTAKTNRAVQVLQMEVSSDDRLELAKGCLGVAHQSDDAALVWQVQLSGLCRAAQRANDFCDLPGAAVGDVRRVFHQVLSAHGMCALCY